MKRFTTPTLPMTVPVDLTGADIYVTIKQGQRKLQNFLKLREGERHDL